MRYLDTSYIAPIFLKEPTTDAVQSHLGSLPFAELAISHWTRVEFASLLGIRVRAGTLDLANARDAERSFELAAARTFTVFVPTVDDFNLAKTYLNRHDTGLRGGDALHLAIANNHSVEAIFSLDKTMIKAGKLLGLPVFAGIR
jgi:hypothetical protein